MHVWLVTGILALVMLLLVSGRVRIDFVGIVALALVGTLGLVPTSRLFSGFSSYAAIILAEMFVLGDALQSSGATNYLTRIFERLGQQGEKRLITGLMLIPPIPSTFISDVGLMSIFLPTMIRLRQKLAVSLHRILMPLVVAIALGGLLSMVGSAGNIIGNATLASSHYRPIPLFGITPLGLVLVLAGYGFMRWYGIQRLPETKKGGEFLTDYQEVKHYLTEIRVSPGSPLVGEPLREVHYFRDHDLTILRITRNGQSIDVVTPSMEIHARDVLLVQGNAAAIMALTDEHGLEMLGQEASAVRLRQNNMRVVEAIIPPKSTLSHRTLRESNFRARFGATVLAIWRHGVTKLEAVRDVRLEVGDVLMVMGTAEALRRLELSDDLVVFSDVEKGTAPRRYAALIAVGVVASVLLAAAFNFLAIQVAAAAGIAVLVLTRVLSLERAYRAIDWRIIVLVGGLTPLSLALTRSGATADVAHTMVHWVGTAGPYAVMALFFWLAALLTQVISNVAAALVMAPLAISVAQGNHWSPDAFIIAMVVALSAAPITPLANKVFIMAMRPGNYQYQDFFRIGLPLTVLMFVLTLILAPVFFPIVSV